MQIGEAKKKN